MNARKIVDDYDDDDDYGDYRYNWHDIKNDPHDIVQKGDFHIQKGDPAKTIICIKCNTDKFIVGKCSYFTAIKCPNCGWEYCVHSG